MASTEALAVAPKDWHSELFRFVASYEINDDTDCWEWTGTTFAGGGYPLLNVRRGQKWRPYGAHRVAYELLVGLIPEGLVIDHLCNNKICVNPEHLEPVTGAENQRRKNERHKRRTHCCNGHELIGDTVAYVRVCRICRDAATARYDAKQKARR